MVFSLWSVCRYVWQRGEGTKSTVGIVDASLLVDWLHIGFGTCEDAKHPYKKPSGRHTKNRGKKFCKGMGGCRGEGEKLFQKFSSFPLRYPLFPTARASRITSKEKKIARNLGCSVLLTIPGILRIKRNNKIDC